MTTKQIREILETRRKVAIAKDNATELLLICSLIYIIDEYATLKVDQIIKDDKGEQK